DGGGGEDVSSDQVADDGSAGDTTPDVPDDTDTAGEVLPDPVDAVEDPVPDTLDPVPDTEDADTDPAEDIPAEEATIGPPGTFHKSQMVDGFSRAYVLHVADSAVAAMGAGPVPLLIGLHGAGDTGENFIFATRLTNTAEANNFVIAGPDGINRGWFIQAEEGWPGTDGNSSSLQNDIDFMKRIIEVTGATYYIDTNRLYVVGHSRGAGMTGLIAFMSGQVTTSTGLFESPFAAYGVNAGYDATGGRTNLAAATPKRPIWVIHGDADSVVPFSYGQSFATALETAGWDVTWTAVSGGTHTWLWQTGYGTSNQDLWDWFAENAIP
ncbi:MAG: PHB depolymerase family esterase, partial [Pseudomonadota bacterium]